MISKYVLSIVFIYIWLHYILRVYITFYKIRKTFFYIPTHLKSLQQMFNVCALYSMGTIS